MHPTMLRQLTAAHIRELPTEAGDARPARKGNVAIGRGAGMRWRQAAARPGWQTIPGRGGACCATAWSCLTTAGRCFPMAGPWLRPPSAQSGRRHEGVPGQRCDSGN